MKNKKLFFVIYIIFITVIVISIITLSFLGYKERIGYLSDFKINIYSTLQLNGFDVNKIEKLFIIDNKIDEAKSKWKSSYFKVITSHSSDDWLWKGNIIDIPESCKNYNLLYGTDSRGVGRDMLLKTMFNLFVMYNAVCSADKISKDLDINISLVNEQANKIKESYEFVKLLQNEDNKTITPEDYSSYLEKYPDAYYKQYCIDGYAMAKADTFTLDTPKDEIKKLLDSGISKGAAKYVKMVTKKSYLKSKSL